VPHLPPLAIPSLVPIPMDMWHASAMGMNGEIGVASSIAPGTLVNFRPVPNQHMVHRPSMVSQNMALAPYYNYGQIQAIGLEPLRFAGYVQGNTIGYVYQDPGIGMQGVPIPMDSNIMQRGKEKEDMHSEQSEVKASTNGPKSHSSKPRKDEKKRLRRKQVVLEKKKSAAKGKTLRGVTLSIGSKSTGPKQFQQGARSTKHEREKESSLSELISREVSKQEKPSKNVEQIDVNIVTTMKTVESYSASGHLPGVKHPKPSPVVDLIQSAPHAVAEVSDGSSISGVVRADGYIPDREASRFNKHSDDESGFVPEQAVQERDSGSGPMIQNDIKRNDNESSSSGFLQTKEGNNGLALAAGYQSKTSDEGSFHVVNTWRKNDGGSETHSGRVGMEVAKVGSPKDTDDTKWISADSSDVHSGALKETVHSQQHRERRHGAKFQEDSSGYVP